MVKPLHLGSAARNGILAAELAAAGFTANPEILDEEGIYLNQLASCSPECLGKTHVFLQPGIAFKVYPCPYSSQKPIDAIIRLAQRYDLKPTDIEEIICLAPQNTFRVLIHHRPTTSLEAKFCLEYLLAAGIMARTVREDVFDIEQVRNPTMQRLVEKVHICEQPLPRTPDSEVTVRVETTSGYIYEQTVSHAPGHPKNPLSLERLQAKYRDCCRQGGLSDMAIADSLTIVMRMEENERVNELVTALQC
jgi:2-methylcitrate dehydratase PrpD